MCSTGVIQHSATHALHNAYGTFHSVKGNIGDHSTYFYGTQKAIKTKIGTS